MTVRAGGAVLAFALLVAGCGSMAYDSGDDHDAFRAAAISWVGAPLDEMISAWGEPAEAIIEAAPGRNGLVRWRATNSVGKPGQHTPGYRCIVEARYGLDRTILRVDTISHNCDDQLAEALDGLTRSRP